MLTTVQGWMAWKCGVHERGEYVNYVLKSPKEKLKQKKERKKTLGYLGIMFRWSTCSLASAYTSQTALSASVKKSIAVRYYHKFVCVSSCEVSVPSTKTVCENPKI